MANLICFMASHVTVSRFPYIIQLFSSIDKQIELCPIYLSWSSEAECMEQMQELINKTKIIIGVYSKIKLSQFQHYRELIKYGNEDSYIMFSDDDDIWAENRIQTMKYYLDYSVENSGGIFSRIIFPDFAELYPDGRTKKKEYKSVEHRQKVDHWASIVPYLLLVTFFNITPEWIISNNQCDMRFCEYTQSYTNKSERFCPYICHYSTSFRYQTVTTNQEQPIYFYRIHDNSICGIIQKNNHRHVESLKCASDINLIYLLAYITHESMDMCINKLCKNLEYAMIRYYPNMERIKEDVISCFKSNNIETAINLLWPSIVIWLKRTYEVQ
jgi:hypothetical protein